MSYFNLDSSSVAKKTPQEEDQSQEKPKVNPVEQNEVTEPVAEEESKDGE